MKTVWVTSLISSEDPIKELAQMLKTYGLQINGHFWNDDLEKVAWRGARDILVSPDISLWLIIASEENLTVPSIRYGLSLLAVTIQAAKGLAYPIALLMKGASAKAEMLPTPLKGIEILALDDPGIGAKLVAMVHAPAREPDTDYRLDVHGNEQIGQWFEVGPRNTSWKGAMFGVSEGEIAFHGVGAKGSLPQKSILDYPVKGLRVQLAEREYTAWAVQNELNADTSYFVQVKGFPASILFGPYSQEGDADVYTVTLK